MSEESRKLKILDEVVANTVFRTEVSHDEWTLAQAMERYHCSKWNMSKVIKRLKDAGAITERPALCNGTHCTAYKFVEGFDPESLKG